MNGLNGNVHLIAGGKMVLTDVLDFLAAEGVAVEANPDLYVRYYASFGIDDAHDLVVRSAARGFAARRIFLITVDSITSEAQNALLKTLEEPVGDTLFFFIIPSPETLLPTFRSRAQMLTIKNSGEQAPTPIEVEEFLKANPSKRIEMLKPLLEKDSDDKRDLGTIYRFLAALEAALSDNFQKRDVRQGIEAVYRARGYIGDRGALIKPLLEQVALLIPQML